MKKQIAILSITACVLVSVFSAGAQTKKVALPWGVAVRGNVIGNVHENVMSYFKHRRFADLVTAGFSVDGMYDFTNIFGTRVSFAMGKNAGACNSQEVGGGFYPYYFRSINVFADAMIHFGTPEDAFSSRIYAGLGYAHTYDVVENLKNGVTNWPHPWATPDQPIPNSKEPNDVFGFRVGYMGEWHITPEVGVLIDACGEFYSDAYDCLMPYRSDHDAYRGYAGFPFDMRFVVSLGIAYHF